MLENIDVMRIKRFAENTAGRDFAVGDIHGHFTRLQAALDAAGFDPAADRLFSVGDLVDRGPECRDVLEWLAKPWFHPVRGNHDDYVCRFDTCDVDSWVYNGGSWFAGLPWDEQREFAAQFRELPIAIEVETPGGLVGVVHADCPFPSWDQLRAALEAPETAKQLRLTQNTCMWSRSRIQDGDKAVVEGLRALVCGHTPLRQPAVLGNVYHIDTAGWMDGHFTLLDLATLQCTPPINPKITHDWDRARRPSMNLIDCYVTKILGEPYRKFGAWWVSVEYTAEGWPGTKEIMFRTEEAARAAKVWHHFTA